MSDIGCGLTYAGIVAGTMLGIGFSLTSIAKSLRLMAVAVVRLADIVSKIQRGDRS